MMSSQENFWRGVSLLPSGPSSALTETGDRYQRGASTTKPTPATMHEVRPVARQAKRQQAEATSISAMLKSEAATETDGLEGSVTTLRPNAGVKRRAAFRASAWTSS